MSNRGNATDPAVITWPEKVVDLAVLVRGVVLLDRAAREPSNQACEIDLDSLVAVLAFCYRKAGPDLAVRR